MTDSRNRDDMLADDLLQATQREEANLQSERSKASKNSQVNARINDHLVHIREAASTIRSISSVIKQENSSSNQYTREAEEPTSG